MPELNRQNLQETFNMAETEVVDTFEQEWERDNDPVQVLRTNIDKANEILDTVTSELNNGNFSARLVEVAGQLINSITTASKEILDNKYKDRYLDIRNQLVLLKEREVEMKALSGHRPTTQNLIIASREDVLKLLRDEKKQIEQEKPTE